jgi:DNA-binding transcriptional LysR family regulator
LKNANQTPHLRLLKSLQQAASCHLKMTQPAISARIRELERELGIVLLDRTGGSARLTGKDEKIVKLASEIHPDPRQSAHARVSTGAVVR